MENKLLIVLLYLRSYINGPLLFHFLWIFIAFLIWRLCRHIYIAAFSPSGIQYVTLKRHSLRMVSSYNPFSFEANYNTASYSGVKCILKSEQTCYIQAFWGVPIYHLFQLLQGDWQSLLNAVVTRIPSQKFSSQCVSANDSFILSAGEEKSIEFKPRWHTNKDALSQKTSCMRNTYPFVVLMVLKNNDGLDDTSVVAMANAIHVPDEYLLLYPQLIGQYVKLASGSVGRINKIFLCSPASSNDGGETYDLCLACYHRPVSVVCLPCRHACLCKVCFDLCEKCPICRATTVCYFRLPNVHTEDND